jgi:hypothetical protein
VTVGVNPRVGVIVGVTVDVTVGVTVLVGVILGVNDIVGVGVGVIVVQSKQYGFNKLYLSFKILALC